jgi:hypothetical protein
MAKALLVVISPRAIQPPARHSPTISNRRQECAMGVATSRLNQLDTDQAAEMDILTTISICLQCWTVSDHPSTS